MTAAATAFAQAEALADLAERWRLTLWDDVAPREADVVGFHDPADDLERRARKWGYSFERADLSELLRFAAGLASAEAEAWATNDPTVATRAYEQRRFLLADRVLHWAVPWLDAVGRCHPDYREVAHTDRNALLDIGDTHRLVPALTGDEGLFQPGEDSFGPVERGPDLAPWVGSLWSGLVVLDATVLSLTGGAHDRSSLSLVVAEPARCEELVHVYQAAAGRWRSLAQDHPGTALLWQHLSARAERTAAAFRAPAR